MRAARRVVHIVRCHDLVLDTKVVQRHDIINRLALERVKIFDAEDVVLAPLQLQSGAVAHDTLHVALVEQVVDALFVDLQVRTVDGELLFAGAALLFDEVKHEAHCSRHDTLVVAGFELGLWRLTLLRALVLVAFHGERLSRASLAVGEDCSMISLK